MAEVINLRRARKNHQRAAKTQSAAQNRAAFGVSRSERALADAQRKAAGAKLDGHLLGAESQRE